MLRPLRVALVAVAVASGVACASPAPEKSNVANDLRTEDGDAVSTLSPGTILRTTADVNLRGSGSTSAKVLDIVPDGDEVTLVDGAPSGGFYHVSYGSETGWVSGSYVTVVSSPAPATPITLEATSDVNLRSTPSTSGSVLGVVPAGTQVTAASQTPTNGFYNITWNGLTGWSSATYYETVSSSSGAAGGSSTTPPPAPPPSGALPTAAELLALTQSCNRVSNGDFSTDVGSSAIVPICGLDGAVFWTSDMDIDCNGPKYSGSPCNAEDDGADDFTSARDANGKSLDAATIPFIVVPGVGSLFDSKAAGLTVGTGGTGSTVVAVIYQNKVAYAVIGDVGGTKVIGEGSYALAKALGINANPNTGGVDGRVVTFIAFTGAASRVADNSVPSQAVALGEARAAALLANP